MLFSTYMSAFVALSVELDLEGKVSFRMSGGCSYDGNQIINLLHVLRNVR
jgi:hypothetical protein